MSGSSFPHPGACLPFPYLLFYIFPLCSLRPVHLFPLHSSSLQLCRCIPPLCIPPFSPPPLHLSHLHPSPLPLCPLRISAFSHPSPLHLCSSHLCPRTPPAPRPSASSPCSALSPAGICPRHSPFLPPAPLHPRPLLISASLPPCAFTTPCPPHLRGSPQPSEPP